MSSGATPDYERVAKFLLAAKTYVVGVNIRKELGIEQNTLNRCINDIKRKGKVHGYTVESRRCKKDPKLAEHMIVQEPEPGNGRVELSDLGHIVIDDACKRTEWKQRADAGLCQCGKSAYVIKTDDGKWACTECATPYLVVTSNYTYEKFPK